MIEEDVDVDCDESSESTDVQSSATLSLVAPNPAAVPCGRAALAGGRGTAAATSLRGAAMKEIPGLPVHSSAGTSGGFAMSYAPCNIGRGRSVWGHCQPGASIESSPSVSEEDEADDSPSPELGGSPARELKWLGETPVVRQGQTSGDQRQLDLESAALSVDEALATDELQE